MLSSSQIICVVVSCIPTIVVVGPLPRCVHISVFHRRFLLHFVSSLHLQSPQYSLRNHCRTHSLLSLSLSLLFPNPRAPLQSESHYNGFLSPSFYLTCPPGSCFCDIAIREQSGTVSFVTLLPQLFSNLVYPSGPVFFSFFLLSG